MMCNKYLEEIIEFGNEESVDTIKYVFDIAMDYLHEKNYSLYKQLEMELYVAVNGEKLNREMAEEIIMKMQPYHMKWSLEQTKELQKQNNLENIEPIDFWIVMNMAANDYNTLFGEDIQKYVEFTKLFISSPDSKDGKVFRYFTKTLI